MGYILLTKNQKALVDDSDMKWLNQWSWKFHSMGYAHRYEWRNNKVIDILMHREIMTGLLKGQQVDHINHDKLDNRRSNLRLSTQTQNLQNASIRSDNKTGFKGVHFNKSRGHFQAYINANSKHIYLGMAKTAEQAYDIYKEAAKHYFGEFANI